MARRLPARLRRVARAQGVPRGRTRSATGSTCPSSGARTSSRSTARTRPTRCEGAEPNAETLVELVDTASGAGPAGEDLGLYRLTPRTGRTHQLRCQLQGLGVPIVDDPLYPVERDVPVGDFSTPLQLLAAVLAFDDPVDGTPRRFVTRRRLARWPGPWPSC